MKRTIKNTMIAGTILLGAMLSAQAATNPASGTGPAPNGAAQIQVASHTKKPVHSRQAAATRHSSGVVTYDRDSPDPNIGWHNEGGMRVCHNDCDNPEIPGSGYTCRNVKWLGMAARECDWSSW